MGVIINHMRSSFTAHTDMMWPDFADLAYGQFDKPHDNVRLVFRIPRDLSTVLSNLDCTKD